MGALIVFIIYIYIYIYIYAYVYAYTTLCVCIRFSPFKIIISLYFYSGRTITKTGQQDLDRIAAQVKKI